MSEATTKPDAAPPGHDEGPPDDLISVTAGAKILLMTTAGLVRWVTTGRIPGWRRGGRLFVSHADVKKAFHRVQIDPELRKEISKPVLPNPKKDLPPDLLPLSEAALVGLCTVSSLWRDVQAGRLKGYKQRSKLYVSKADVEAQFRSNVSPVGPLPEDLISLAEAARFARVGNATMWRWAKRGHIRSWRRGERVFVSRAEADKLFQQMEPEPPKRTGNYPTRLRSKTERSGEE